MSKRFRLKRAHLIERLNDGAKIRSVRLKRYGLLDYVPEKKTPPPTVVEEPLPETTEESAPAPEPVVETPKPAPKKAAPKRKPAAKKAAPKKTRSKKAAPKAEKSEE
tara:strand:- start:148 stop:468 length:321 start_codon:yes stop_codon:yes gene_type:complete